MRGVNVRLRIPVSFYAPLRVQGKGIRQIRAVGIRPDFSSCFS